jgi:hypothetical protein
MTASWVVLISALGAGPATRAATLFVVAIWSLKADKRGREHAIKLLKILVKGRSYNG